ncbi:MAG: phosphoribosylformylglycinamidine synthase subunit PurS [Raoultibacter sp.]|jgi:phosphoribosylformylglycinamidine synthase PurS subunit
MKQYQIFVTGKEGIFDPAGETSKSALENLGYSSIESLRIGKFIELEVADATTDEEVEEMCQKLLANPVIEDYTIKSV